MLSNTKFFLIHHIFKNITNYKYNNNKYINIIINIYNNKYNYIIINIIILIIYIFYMLLILLLWCYFIITLLLLKKCLCYSIYI